MSFYTFRSDKCPMCINGRCAAAPKCNGICESDDQCTDDQCPFCIEGKCLLQNGDDDPKNPAKKKKKITKKQTKKVKSTKKN